MPGIRARRKAATRKLLSQAALTLFARQGYDGTTVSEIAATAGVTERAFFLHFPTKADALYDLGPEDLEELRQRILAQPPSLSDYDALCQASVAYLLSRDDPKTLHQQAQLLFRGAASSPTLRGKQFDENQLLADVSIDALTARRGLAEPTLAIRMTALVVLRLLHASYLEWAETGAPGDLTRMATAQFNAARDALRG
jgi:AcrR family transcriptional regulator